MKRIIASIIIALSISACKPDPLVWRIRKEPVTQEERAQIAFTEATLLGTPANDDHRGQTRGWDDAIRAAHDVAVDTVCKPRLWELDPNNGQWTGKYKEIEEVKPNK